MSAGVISGNAFHIEVRDITVDLASVATITSGETSVTVNGVKTSDFVFVNGPSLTAGLGIVNCRVTAENTIAIDALNTTAGAINQASGTYKLLIIRPE